MRTCLNFSISIRNMIHDVTTFSLNNAHVKSKSSPEHIHNSLTFLVRLGNCFGLLPVTGLGSNASVNALKFDWKSWKSLYSYFAIAVFGLDAILCVIDWARTDTLFNDFVTQIYNLNAFIILILYLHLAVKWPKFMEKWSQIDAAMKLHYGYPQKFNRRVKILSIGFVTAAIGHAVFYIIFVALDVEENKNEEITLENVLKRLFPELFLVFPVNLFTAFVVFYLCFIENVIGVFNDLFIIIISTALALRFKQISDRLSRHVKKQNSDEFWIKIRADYDRVVRLSKKVDKYLSYIVLTSFSVNILWLLVKISNVVGQKQFSVQIFFNIYSFGLLIARLTLVSLYAAWVNDESKEPMTFLNAVPSNTYNNEIRRFILQISFNDVAITGSKLFKVTRGLILSIAGAIVTYELVVIQFRNTLSSK